MSKKTILDLPPAIALDGSEYVPIVQAGITKRATVEQIAFDDPAGGVLAVEIGGTGANNPADARANLGVAIGSDVQAWHVNLDSWSALDPSAKQDADATLTALAGVTTAADKMIYAIGEDQFSTTDLTAFARSILDDASEAEFKATVNLEIGTDVQAYSANLDGWSAVAPSSYYTKTEADAAFQPLDSNLTAWAAVNPSSYYTAAEVDAGFQPLDADLTAIAALSTQAYGRSLLTAANEAGFKQLVNLEIGVDVQAYSANLDAWSALVPSAKQDADATLTALAGVSTAADKLIYATGSDTFTTTDLTSFARTVLDDTDAATARSTLGAAASGANSDITSLTALESINGGPLGSFRNKIINGDGRINQRVASSIGDDTYGHDRHYALTQSGNIGVSTLTAPADGIAYMMRLTQSDASAQRMGYAQIIEAAETYGLRGKTVTLGGKLRYSNAAAVRFAVLEWTGTADQVTSDVVNDWTSGSYAAGGFFIGAGLTVAAVGAITPAANVITDWSLTATISSSANNLIVVFWTEGTAAQNSALDMRWYLVEGDATAEDDPFSPRHIQQELALCERYYQLLRVRHLWQSPIASGLDARVYNLRVPMRAEPSVVASVGSLVNVAAYSVDLVSSRNVGVSVTATASGIVDLIANLTCDAEL